MHRRPVRSREITTHAVVPAYTAHLFQEPNQLVFGDFRNLPHLVHAQNNHLDLACTLLTDKRDARNYMAKGILRYDISKQCRTSMGIRRSRAA